MEKEQIKIGVVGVGLIGGSMALDLKRNNFCYEVIGVDHNPEHLKEALALEIIDSTCSLVEVTSNADIIIIATPVNSTIKILNTLLDQAPEKTIIIDVGSIKAPVCEQIANHKNRSQYVACHPIAGTEFSGPKAALKKLFNDKVNIICEAESSKESALKAVCTMFESLGSRTIFMDAATHDQHITYVSHLSHITSFALSLTVQELEKADQNIYNMAGSGFTSTVRLAKSSANMWVPIFMENKQNMVRAIDDYINKLQLLKDQILANQGIQLADSIKESNKISKVIDR